ncbi:hypothetical protein [Sphingobium sp.]|uniref:hypothetical protein n=1 Tax=Sphingobium sp. TaxID=1912891 RepID=UPI00263924E5|nr:hypothetical protein [Sphingobium sp.]
MAKRGRSVKRVGRKQAGNPTEAPAAQAVVMQKLVTRRQAVGQRIGGQRGGGKRAGAVGAQAGAKDDVCVQLAPARSDGWTEEKEQRFLATLAMTCNTSEAARASGMCRASVYRRRSKDAAFADAWMEAKSIGYEEIELMAMRAVRFGDEVEEMVYEAVKAQDRGGAPEAAEAGAGVEADRAADAAVHAGAPVMQMKTRKVKRSRDLSIALRLLTFHREGVMAYREARAAAQSAAQRPDSPEAIAQSDEMMRIIRRERTARGE